MSSIDEIRGLRIKKLALFKKKGVNPYPAESKRELYLKEAIDSFDALEKGAKEGKMKWIAGRIMSIRGQGAIIFITLYDGTGVFQALLKKDVLGDEKFDFWYDVVDIGDLVDVDERFRKRYLDILMNPEIKDIFIKKEKFWDATRKFLKKEGFLEVETPTLEITTGGAEAKPFQTHHHDFDIDVYLRISVGELWQKRLLAAGFPRVFEIGRCYRNEGSSPEHTQEFTNMEFYASYMDYRQGMEFTEKM